MNDVTRTTEPLFAGISDDVSVVKFAGIEAATILEIKKTVTLPF